jgi:hypothetical protein
MGSTNLRETADRKKNHFLSINTPKLWEEIPKTSSARKLDIAETKAVKTLGLTWLPSTDNLAVSIKSTFNYEIVTKRSILSDIARFYDPLGICGSIILTAKVTLQQLWLKQLDWDNTLDEEYHSSWVTFKNQLREIHLIEFVSQTLASYCTIRQDLFPSCLARHSLLCSATSLQDEVIARAFILTTQRILLAPGTNCQNGTSLLHPEYIKKRSPFANLCSRKNIAFQHFIPREFVQNLNQKNFDFPILLLTPSLWLVVNYMIK